MATPKGKSNALSMQAKNQLIQRDIKVFSDPFGIRAGGSKKEKADVLSFLENKLKNKYKTKYLGLARKMKDARFESGIDLAQAILIGDVICDKARQMDYPEQEINQVQAHFEAGFFPNMSDMFLGKTREDIADMANSGTELMNNVNGAFTTIRDRLPSWVGMVAFCVFLNEATHCLMMVMYPNWVNYLKFNYTIFCISGVLCLHFFKDFSDAMSNSFRQLQTLVSNLWNGVQTSQDPVFEAGFVEDPLTAMLSLVVPITLSVCGLKKMAWLGDMYDVVVNVFKEVLKDFSKMKAGTIDLCNIVSQLVSYSFRVVKWCLFCRNKHKFPLWQNIDMPADIEIFTDDVAEFCLSNDKNELVSNTSNYFKVLSLIRKGEKLLSTCKHRPTVVLLSKKLKELQDIKSRITVGGCFIQGARPEPFAITLEGIPGQGKSSMVERIHTDIWSRLVPKDLHDEFLKDPLKYKFVRDSSIKHWEGYTPEKLTCVWDDFGQSREELTGVMESLELIRALNSFPMHLPFAAIENKASNFFVSRLAVITTNCEGYNRSKLIKYQEALDRRLNKNRYRVILHDRYIVQSDTDEEVRKFDPFHPDKKTPGLLTDEDVYFDKVSYVGGSVRYCRVTYDEIVQHAVSSMKQAMETFELRMADLIQVAKQGSPLFEMEPMELSEAINNSMDADQRSSFEKELRDLDQMDLQDLLEIEDGAVPDNPEPLFSKIEQMYSRLANKYGVAVGIEKAQKFVCSMSKSDFFEFDVSKLSELNKTVIASVATVTGVAAGIGLAFGAYTLFVAWRDKNTKKTFESYTPRVQPQKQENMFKRRVVRTANRFEAGSCDVKAEAFARKLLRKNIYTLSILGKKVGFVTFVEGSIAIFPAHFLGIIEMIIRAAEKQGVDKSLLEAEFTNTVASSKNFNVFVVDLFENHYTMERKDLAIVDFGKKVVQHTSIMHQICSYKDDPNVKGMLCIPENDNNVISNYFRTVKLHYTHDSEMKFDSVPLDGKSIVSYTEVKTEKGDCGAPLIALGGTVNNHPYIGFHTGSSTAGYSSRGYSTRVFVEDVELLMQQFDTTNTVRDSDAGFEEDVDDNVLGVFEAGYVFPKSYAGASKSKIKKTILYECWGTSKRDPAKLTPFYTESGDLVVPMEKALLKYDHTSVAIHDVFVEKAKLSLLSNLNKTQQFACPYNKRVMSFEEAIIGVHGDKAFSAISRTTSPGFPHVLNNHTHGKKYWLGFEDHYDLDNKNLSEVRKVVEKAERDAKIGVRSFWVYLDNVKDELLLKHKVAIGKTRVFSATPFELLILFRMYFGSFSSWIVRNNTFNGIAVGLNPYSMDWDHLSKKLEAYGDGVVAGDFSGYDTRQVPQVSNAILDLINDWYGDSDENKLVRWVLWQEIVNSRHMLRNKIYSWTGSLPSGNPLTSIVNCLYNHMLFRMCWEFGIFSGVIPKDHSFNDNSFICVLGDDNIMSSSVSQFNQNFITSTMPVFGQDYTDELKSTERMPDWRNIEEVTFLKRSFRWEPLFSRMVAPLCKDTLFEILYWHKSQLPEEKQAAANLELVLREYSLHDPSEWNLTRNMVDHVFKAYGYYPEFSSREEYLQLTVTSEMYM